MRLFAARYLQLEQKEGTGSCEIAMRKVHARVYALTRSTEVPRLNGEKLLAGKVEWKQYQMRRDFKKLCVNGLLWL
jgi:hypothetical protein